MEVKESSVVTSLRVQQGDATREALLKAAEGCFGEHGYAESSVVAIAARAGVTKGAFYHHFETKRDVFESVFRVLSAEVGRRAFIVHLDRERVVAGRPAIRDLVSEDDAAVWRHVTEGCRAYLEHHLDPAVRRILLVDGPAVLPMPRWTELREEHGTVLLRADLRRAMRRGIIAPVPLRTLAAMIAGALDAACLLTASSPNPRESLDEAFAVVSVLLDGLKRVP